MRNRKPQSCARLKSAVVCAAFLLLASPALGDNCVSGALNTLIGTTCDIGMVQFTFLSFTNESQQSGEAALTPQNVFMTVNASNPWNPSFTLSGNFTATAPGNNFAISDIDLDYWGRVFTPFPSVYPVVLYGVGAAYNPATVSINPTSSSTGWAYVSASNNLGPSSDSYGGAEAYYELSNESGVPTISTENPATVPVPSDYPWVISFSGFTDVTALANPPYTRASFNDVTSSFILEVQTPEPGSLALMATALCILALIAAVRCADPRI